MYGEDRQHKEELDHFEQLLAEHVQNRQYVIGYNEEEQPPEKTIIERIQRYYLEDIQGYLYEHMNELLPPALRRQGNEWNSLKIRKAICKPLDELRTRFVFLVHVLLSNKSEPLVPQYHVEFRFIVWEDMSPGKSRLQIEQVSLADCRPKDKQQQVEGNRTTLKPMSSNDFFTEEQVQCRKDGIRVRGHINSELAIVNNMPRDRIGMLHYITDTLCGGDANQAAIAAASGVSTGQVSKVLNGGSTTFKTMARILLAVNCPPILSSVVLREVGYTANFSDKEEMALYAALLLMYDREPEDIRAFVDGYVFGGVSKEKTPTKSR